MQRYIKYRQRSTKAINRLRMCLKYADAISKYEKIGDKYKTLANYMGLAQEGGNIYYNYFIPINENILFMLRNANHEICIEIWKFRLLFLPLCHKSKSHGRKEIL